MEQMKPTMRWHIHYGFGALVLAAVLVCFLSYLSIHPVKQSKPRRSKTRLDIALLMHRNPVLVTEEDNSNFGHQSSALRNTSVWIKSAAAADAAADDDDDADADSDDYYSSLSSSLDWLYHYNETDETPEPNSYDDKDRLKKSKLSKFPETINNNGKVPLDVVPGNKLRNLISSGISPNLLQTAAYIQNENIQNDDKLQKIVQLKYDSTSLIKPTKLKSKVQSGAERQDVMPNSNRLSQTDIKTSHSNKDSHCTPKKNIVFFKTHKCATSTVQNIMFRYGDKHQLRFVLPKSKDHRFSLKEPFNRREVLTNRMTGQGLGPFNIFTNHAIFNQIEIEAIMPPDSIYISILRDPVAMYESMYTYLRLDHRYSDDDTKYLVSMEEFLDNAPYFYQDWDKVYGGRFSRNPMLYDFGLHPDDMNDVTKINQLISIIDQRFDLIMMADYFQESLVMLKNLLCLDFDDVTYLTFNARSEESVHRINDRLAKKIRAWNWGDVRLFNHFNRTFHKKLQMFSGDQMRREKIELEKRNEQLKEFCVAGVAVDMESVWHPEGVKIESFRLKDDQKDENGICKMITRPEKVYTDILKERQSSVG